MNAFLDPTVLTALIGAVFGGIATLLAGIGKLKSERGKARIAIEAASAEQARAIHSDVAVAVREALAVYRSTLDHMSGQMESLRDEVESLNAHVTALTDVLTERGIQPPPKPPRRQRAVSASPDMTEE